MAAPVSSSTYIPIVPAGVTPATTSWAEMTPAEQFKERARLRELMSPAEKHADEMAKAAADKILRVAKEKKDREQAIAEAKAKVKAAEREAADAAKPKTKEQKKAAAMAQAEKARKSKKG